MEKMKWEAPQLIDIAAIPETFGLCSNGNSASQTKTGGTSCNTGNSATKTCSTGNRAGNGKAKKSGDCATGTHPI